MVFCYSIAFRSNNEVPTAILAEANLVAFLLHFACSRRMLCLALKVQVGLQSVQELLQGVRDSLGLISRRQRRRKKSLSDLGIGRERDKGAGSRRFHRHDWCPLGCLETPGSTLAPSRIENCPACNDQERKHDREQGEYVIVGIPCGLLSR